MQGRSILIGVALTIGIVVSIGEPVVFAAALNRPIDLTEFDVLFANVVLVAIPFLALALKSRVRAAAWIFALAITLALRGWWLAHGIAYQRNPDGSGADILSGLLLLISPFAIIGAAQAVDWVVSRWSTQDRVEKKRDPGSSPG